MTLWERAKRAIPGGVNSPVRAFGGVGGEPLFMERALGAKIFAEGGREFTDFVLSFGPMILGHNPPAVIEALKAQLARGLSYGACTRAEVELAELILAQLPFVDMVRLVNSGTEATMTAIRIARGYTGRDKILKFRGCYHGHGDSFLIQAGSGALTHGTPSSLGVTAGVARDTLVCDYNDLEAVEKLFDAEGEEIAAVIVEPVAGNMGVVPPAKGFLEGLRAVTKKFGSVLIFDEVMTGFRLSGGGAAKLFNIDPDMVTLGKVVGGGMPLAAYAGKREIMECVSPLGGVYQAGTLSGNPLAVAAGLAQMKLLLELSPWETLDRNAAEFSTAIREAAAEFEIPLCLNRVGSMFTIFFSGEPVTDTRTALAANKDRFAQFFHGMLDRDVYLPPSQFEACFTSTAHTPEVLSDAAKKVREVFETMAVKK